MVKRSASLESEIDQVQETATDKISKNQCILRGDDCKTTLSLFSRREGEFSEKEIIQDPLKSDESIQVTDSTYSSSEIPQNETTKSLIDYKRSSVSREAIDSCGDDEVECDSYRKALALQSLENTSLHRSSVSFESTHINDTSKGAPDNTDTLWLRQQLNGAAVSPIYTEESNNNRTILLEISTNNGSLENDNDQQNEAYSKGIAGLSDEKLSDAVNVDTASENVQNLLQDREHMNISESAVHVDAASENVQNLLQEREYMEISENDTQSFFCNVLKPERAHVDNSLPSVICETSDFCCSNISSDVPIKTIKTGYGLPAYLLEKPLGSLTMPLTTIKTESLLFNKGNVEQVESNYEESEERCEFHNLVNVSTHHLVVKKIDGLLRDKKALSDYKSGNINHLTSFGDESLKSINSIESDKEDDFKMNLSDKNSSSNTLITSGFIKKTGEEHEGTILDFVSFGDSLSENQSSENLFENPNVVNRTLSVDAKTEKDFSSHVQGNDNNKPVNIMIVSEVQGKEDGSQEQVEMLNKDEGELSDDDVEEGEIKEPGDKKSFVKTVCQFFQKGTCTWGISCSFLHPGVNDKGNYRMIEVPGFMPVGARARLGAPGSWPEDKAIPPARYSPLYGTLEERFEQDRLDLRQPFRPGEPPFSRGYTSPLKQPEEWTDPWTRSKSTQFKKKKLRSMSRGRRKHRSVSDYSHSSRSSSGSSSSSSRSKRSASSSSNSLSRSRSPKPAPPAVDRFGRYISPSREQPRSDVLYRAPGIYTAGYQAGDHYRQEHSSNYNGASAIAGFSYTGRNSRGRSRDRTWRRARSPPDRPLPYARPRQNSDSSSSDSSKSRSRSSSRKSFHSKSARKRSRLTSTSSSSAGSPSNHPRAPAAGKKFKSGSRANQSPMKGSQLGSQKQRDSTIQLHINLDEIPHPSDPKPTQPITTSGKPESKFTNENAPQTPVKTKVLGRKSNIRLTLQPKHSPLGNRPNPLDSPPHIQEISDSDSSFECDPPAKKVKLPMVQSPAQTLAPERATKVQLNTDQGKALLSSIPQPSSVCNVPQVKAAVLPQKQQAVSGKIHVNESSVTKPAPKSAVARVGAKTKKITTSQREELLKHLKEVEDAIARKKLKLQ